MCDVCNGGESVCFLSPSTIHVSCLYLHDLVNKSLLNIDNNYYWHDKCFEPEVFPRGSVVSKK